MRTFDMLKRRAVPVYFDPYNREHINAFEMQCIGEARDDGKVYFRTHPTLRFVLESPFVDIRTMMLYKVGQAYINLKG